MGSPSIEVVTLPLMSEGGVHIANIEIPAGSQERVIIPCGKRAMLPLKMGMYMEKPCLYATLDQIRILRGCREMWRYLVPY